jgi:hypothetical protein
MVTSRQLGPLNRTEGQYARRSGTLVGNEQEPKGSRKMCKSSLVLLGAVVAVGRSPGHGVRYFDYGNSAATGFVDCPDEISAAALAASENVGADRALTKSKGSRPAQQQ